MQLNKLELFGFRNYGHIVVEPDPQVNLILGDNAQGKTNLLESIVYLSTGRAFRTRKEEELIGFDRDFADLNATIFSQEREQTLRAVLFRGRKRRQLYKNGVKQKSGTELQGILNTVLFCPEDLQVLKSGAAARRRFLDTALCQLRPNYAKALTEYTRLQEHKNRILKDRFDNPALLDALPEFNQRMAMVGAVLVSYRANYLREMAAVAARFHNAFSGGLEDLEIQYRTVSTIRDPHAPKRDLYQWIMDHQQSHYHAELESCQCLTGPHKDDFDVLLGGRSLKSYGSQGQTRTAAISLKLSERELSRRDTGEEPILLLDDVLSELDPGRQDFVLNQIQTGQVFITCCEKEKLTRLGQVFLIEDGKLRN
jgi:DNA replication and repair protein RecF